MKKILLTLMMSMAVLAFYSCKKSVEGETNSWNSNKQKINDLKALYPGFKAPLDEKMKMAESKWSEAEGAGDDDSKIKKMAEANSILTSDFISKLSSYDRDKKNLQEKIVDVQGADLDMNDMMAANSARSQAQNAINNADMRLNSGANNISGANAILNQIDSDFDAAEKILDKVLSNSKSKKQAADDKAKEDQDKLDQQKAEDEAKTAPWTCSYCGKSNPADKTECEGCGAPK